MKQEIIKVPEYERVVAFDEPEVGLFGIIAIHNTVLGPAVGGIRLRPYPTKEATLNDVLRLSRGMTYKSSLAGINFGGGKSVLSCDPMKKTPKLFQVFGECIANLKGKYIAAQDMNITSHDLAEVKKRTDFVLGIEGEANSSGDPSPFTARGILRAMEATQEELTRDRSVAGVKVAVQGLGSVGIRLVELLSLAGAKVSVSDIDPKKMEMVEAKYNARAVEMNEIYKTSCDIFSPCAIGGVLNKERIEVLKCRAVVGGANNQLATPQDGERLHNRGILYAPDYAVNAGGIINIFVEFEGYHREVAEKKVDKIYLTMKMIYQRSRLEKKPPFVIADIIAEERIRGQQ